MTPRDPLRRKGSALLLLGSLEEIPRLAEEVSAFCEGLAVPARISMHLSLALDEVLTNIVSYGFDDGCRPRIEVTLALEDGALRAVVRDGGKPFDPLALPPPDLDLPLEERRIGGLGIHFVRELMDEVAYRREGNGNVLTLLKRIGAVEEPA